MKQIPGMMMHQNHKLIVKEGGQKYESRPHEPIMETLKGMGNESSSMIHPSMDAPPVPVIVTGPG